MNELQLRRALVALNYLLNVQDEDIDVAKENARVVLNCCQRHNMAVILWQMFTLTVSGNLD
jgi:hypothetical protein